MVLFKRNLIAKILAGEKTQTRRVHRRTWTIGKVYPLRDRWYLGKHEAVGFILITRKFRQKLGNISIEDAEKEGYNSLEEFRIEWIKLCGSWNPEQTVIVYEFKLLPKREECRICQ